MRQIDAVQALRALAALMVVVGHAQSEAVIAAVKIAVPFTPLWLLPWGAGVDIFFVISGFIMVVSSDRLFARPGGPATFASRRLKRIVPLYWLFTTVYVAIQFAMHKPLGPGNILASYLFWPRDVYDDGVLRPIYALGWTLNYEMFFYALFAVAVALPRRIAVASVALTLCGGVAIGRIVELPPGPLSFWTQPIVLEFALGMVIGLAWCEGIRFGRSTAAACFVAGFALLAGDGLNAASQSLHWITPTDLSRLFAWGFPATAIVGAAVLAAVPKRAWFSGAVALGDASYALYLVHPFIVLTAIRGWTSLSLGNAVGFWPFVLTCIALAIGAALALHRWAEAPIGRLLASKKQPISSHEADNAGRTGQAEPAC